MDEELKNNEEVVEETQNEVEEITLDDIPSFEDDMPTISEEDIKTEEEMEKENMENQIRFVKSLNPEYKAQMVFSIMQKQEGARPIVGHEKRILLRKLTRDAKKGKLDKYFIQK